MIEETAMTVTSLTTPLLSLLALFASIVGAIFLSMATRRGARLAFSRIPPLSLKKRLLIATVFCLFSLTVAMLAVVADDGGNDFAASQVSCQE
jgi:hypothetical protein